MGRKTASSGDALKGSVLPTKLKESRPMELRLLRGEVERLAMNDLNTKTEQEGNQSPYEVGITSAGIEGSPKPSRAAGRRRCGIQPQRPCGACFFLLCSARFSSG
jgi:hypothetical protein